MQRLTRRDFWRDTAARLTVWASSLGLLGFRFHPYTIPNGAWRGWVTWFGRMVGFVPERGPLFWFFGR